MRQERINLRTAELLRQDKETDDQMVAAAIERSKNLDTTAKGKYSIWRRDYEALNADSTLKLMRDQIIMAKAYANIAKTNNESSLYDSLMTQSRRSQRAIGEANSDAELQPRFFLVSFISSDYQAYALFVALMHSFSSFPASLVHLSKRKQWATFSRRQRTNYMTAL